MKSLRYRSPGAKPTIDFGIEEAQRALTKALLHRDFKITIEIPENRLCPPVPNRKVFPLNHEGSEVNKECRLNYLLWIQDIALGAQLGLGNVVNILDIGTGASAIYPLLGCRLDPQWRFFATDIDETSFATATNNVANNGLQHRVELSKNAPDDPLFKPLQGDRMFGLTMCNPPFYGSASEITEGSNAKGGPHSTVCTGADVEMITPGGESAFVLRMIDESLGLKDKCSWYTSMVGKKATLFEVVGALRRSSIENYGITEFIQGQTRRWAVAWSFGTCRLPDVCVLFLHPITTTRISNPTISGLMPPRNTLFQTLQNSLQAERLREVVEQIFGALEGVDFIEVTTTDDSEGGGDLGWTVKAKANSWSRSARRKRNVIGAGSGVGDGESVSLVCHLSSFSLAKEISGFKWRWVRGKDRDLFESLFGHICRKILSSIT